MSRLVVVISGSGTNLQAIIDACRQQQLAAEVVAVFSNRPQAPGLARAAAAGIPTQVLQPADYPDRHSFDQALADQIAAYQPSLVILAGYMRILGADFVQRFSGQLLNIHPSLLPRYPGLDTHRQVLANQDSWHGASVHFVTEQLDGGPVILQGKIAVEPQDNEARLRAKVQQQEYQIYPQVIDWFLQGRLALRSQQAWFDGEPLPASGVSR